MSEQATSSLVDYLIRHYGSLKSRLARVLGSSDLAGDALQDTWLRLQTKDEEEQIQNPAGYLLRMTVNIAIDIQRRQSRSVSLDEINEVIEMADPAPGTEHIVQARSEIEAVMRHIERLPKRQQDVIYMVHWDGMEQKEVARRLDISLRTVESDLKKAHDFLIAQRKNE